MEEIVNRVANSPLVTIDLEQWRPEGKRILFDLKDFLFEELLLKEKDFRAQLKTHDWAQYQDCLVAVDCTSDAIVPGWAYMLVTTFLAPYTAFVMKGDLDRLEHSVFLQKIQNRDLTEFQDQKVIIKGCSHNVPESAYVELAQRLVPIVSSLMYGEPCSTVPLYKRR